MFIYLFALYNGDIERGCTDTLVTCDRLEASHVLSPSLIPFYTLFLKLYRKKRNRKWRRRIFTVNGCLHLWNFHFQELQLTAFRTWAALPRRRYFGLSHLQVNNALPLFHNHRQPSPKNSCHSLQKEFSRSNQFIA
jgi:hypothetical protein